MRFCGHLRTTSRHRVLAQTMNQGTNRIEGRRPAKHLSAAQVALNACEIEGSKGSIKGKLKQAGWNDNFLARLLTQPIQRQMR